MKRSTTAVIVGVLALGLVGGGTAMALSNSGEPTPEASASAPAPVGTDAPVGAATDAPATPAPIITAGTPSAPLAETDPEAAFFAEVHARKARINSQIPNATDEQLLALGWQACDRKAAGEPSEDMTLIEGEKKTPEGYYQDSGVIIVSATLTICPLANDPVEVP